MFLLHVQYPQSHDLRALRLLEGPCTPPESDGSSPQTGRAAVEEHELNGYADSGDKQVLPISQVNFVP